MKSETTIKVSVIVPVYNVEKYLDRCIQPLLHQTLQDIEIILVDDGSWDNCPFLCEEYARNDARVKVIHKKNAGLGFARNSGLDIAVGEYVAYCDSDDYVTQDAYECLYNAAIQYDADVVYGSFYKETSPGIWKEQRKVSKEIIIEGDDVKNYLLDMLACAPYVKEERKHDMSSCMSIYRRSLIEKNNIRFTSERVNASEDTIYNIDFLKQSYRIVQIPYTFYYYCLNSSSLSHTFLPEKLDRFVILRQQMIERLGAWDLNHERSNRFYIGYVRSFLICAFNSNCKNIRCEIKTMINNPVWSEIKYEYKPSYLPWHARIIYWLILRRCLILLVIVGWCMAKLWMIKSHSK